MKKTKVGKSLAIAVQFMFLIAAPGLTRTQSPAPQVAKSSTLSGTQGDPVADAFKGLTYTDKQNEAINNIRQDIASRKAAVMKDTKLTSDQKDAMLTGYTRMQYALIYKQLSPMQKKQVSTRIHANRAADQAAEQAPAPAR